MRPSFVKLPKPFIVSVVGDKEPDGAIATIKRAEYDGADAFDLHMMSLERQYHNYKDLRKIISSTVKPVFLLYYRWNMKGMLDVPDDERVEAQLVGIEAGAAGLDITADIFDPSPGPDSWTPEAHAYSTNRNSKPREISMKPEVIDKQKKLIERVHNMGAEVLLSAHTRVVMNCEQVVELAKEMESRGPDAVKIVTVALNEDDLIEAMKTTVELKKTLKVPFQFQCHGEHGKILRVVGPMLGSMLIFCNQQFNPGGFHHQPLVRSMRKVLQNVDWRVTKPVDEEMFI